MNPRLWLLPSALGLILLFAYTNCSQVSFNRDPDDLFASLNSTAAVFINEDALYTNSKDVRLTIQHNSAAEMYITNVEGCADGGQWEPYQKNKAWMLGLANQNATVYIKFRERAGGQFESSCFSDMIVHDDIPPAIQIETLAAFIGTTSSQVRFTVNDNLSGIEKSLCQIDQVAASDCQDTYAFSSLDEGSHQVRVSARDLAGNVTRQVVSFGVDLTPPTVFLNSVPPQLTALTESLFSFSATDNLSGVSRFECQIGSASYQTCTSPFSQTLSEGPQTLSVRAIDQVGNISAPVSYTWTIDKTAPSVQITSAPPAFSNQTEAKFAFTGSDEGVPATRYDCSIDGSVFSTCSSPHTTAPLTAGNRSFSVRAYDSAGNRSAPAVHSWMIDLTKPVVSFVSGPAPVTALTAASFRFSASDAHSGIAQTQCALDGGSFQNCSLTPQYSGLTEGVHKLQVQATDHAGNLSAPAIFSWRVDLTPPVLQILTGPLSLTKEPNAVFTMLAADPGGGAIARIECRLDAEVSFQSCTSPQPYADLNEGAHSFSARAVDEAGNISPVQSHNWVVDLTGPLIQFREFPLSSLQSYETATVVFSVTDSAPLADISCGLNGNLQPCRAEDQKEFSNLAKGDYTFAVVAKDALGNQSRNEVSWSIINSFVMETQELVVGVNKQVDVLVVIDNSGSMATEQQNMAQRFGTFIDQLSGLQWQVGIVTTDVTGTRANQDGRLLAFKGLTNQYVLHSGMDVNVAKTAFGSTIQRPEEEGTSNETGIAASYRAIQRSQDATKPENAANRALFRPNAALSILVVTDADETSAKGTQTRNKPEELIKLVQMTWPQKPFRFHSIIVQQNDSVCLGKSANEDYGLSYAKLSQLTGGIVGSVCATNYATQLTAMGQGTADLVRSATLRCMPQDTTGDGIPDLQITLPDGKPMTNFTLKGMNLQLNQNLPVGTTVMQYNCLK